MAWWRAPLGPALLALVCPCAAACSDHARQDAPRPPSAAITTAATGASPAAAGSSPSSAPASSRTGGAAADDGLVTLDLGPAGDAWSGVTARVPSGATPSGDGSGGAIVFLAPGRPVVLSTSPGAIADHRLGATAAAQIIEGSITFSTDTPQEIAYEEQALDLDGDPLRTWGFATTVRLGRGKVVCSYATARDERELATARAVCASLAR